MENMKVNLKDEQIITKDNVKELGERIAIRAVQNAKRFAFGSLDNLYRGLIHDIFYHKTNENYSEGYDIAQEVICFLCNHLGKQLGDVCQKSSRGNGYDSVRLASFKTAYIYLRKQKKNIFNECNLENAKLLVDKEVFKEPDNFARVNELVRRMNLNTKELDVLKCYYNKMKFQDIADILHIDRTTVARRKKKIQNKFLLYC